MATIHPFRAIRPVPEKAEQIASVPYDVISSSEARKLAEGNPLSFLHVIRPEIDLPPGTDEHDEAVYEKGAENLRAFIGSVFTVQEDIPALYVYRLVMGEREQTGVFAGVSVEEYDNDTILKHEKTRQAKEDDRTRHILAQGAHTEPVMLTYRDRDAIQQIISKTQESSPLYDFAAPDGVRHTIWKVQDAGSLVAAFHDVQKLYVADGHHRCKAASRAAAELRAQGVEGDEFAFFPAVLFPMTEMHILPYNRIVRKLPEGPSRFLEKLNAHFPAMTAVEDPTPRRKGEIGLYLGGVWRRIVLPPSGRGDAADQLDVARLNEHLLEPLLGITDPRTDSNIDFVGGIRGIAALERLVDEGEAELAISMYPTSIEELIAVSDAGLLMPPKSTWFEPKLRSGLLVHVFAQAAL